MRSVKRQSKLHPPQPGRRYGHHTQIAATNVRDIDREALPPCLAPAVSGPSR